MSVAAIASASVSVTALPEIATEETVTVPSEPPIGVRSTVNTEAAGPAVFRSSLNVTVSAAPFTAAEATVGAVLSIAKVLSFVSVGAVADRSLPAMS